MGSRRSSGTLRTRRPLGVDLVVHGDAQEALRRIPANSVQLAITSPPYNLRIEYAGYADDRAHDEYLAWLKEVWRDLHRVLVVGGRFALNVAPTSIKAFRPIHHELTADLRALGYIMRTEVIWYKQTMGRRTAWGSWRSPSNPHIVPSWEYVLVFSKGQWKLPGRKEDSDLTSAEFQSYSDGFWAIPPERARRGHPAPFPEALIERLVKFYSYRGNTVLDMFGGTGTVGAVARRHGRHYLSVDASLEYCERAAERIARATPVEGAPAIPAPRLVELVGPA
ncbi:MAG: site-specific DNA-methyltransferase [Thermoplasmata archaeon]|nr:site-specific DNA-methyltransferase [Thermoplasmata archaeon]MCI4356855.1 site-specific DNA-methyltransferase [Thermoplasmata archaeon]